MHLPYNKNHNKAVLSRVLSITKLNIPTPGNKTKWQASTVTSILTNEKYKGDAILQKYFTVDFLSKKRKLNEGEVQQYYIEDSHPAIISPEVFDLVQIEFQKRKGKRTSTAGIFASKLICGECNGYYGSKVWHSNSKYRRTIWQCNQKFKNKEKCKTPHFTDEQLQKYFVDMFNSTIENRDEIISTIEDMIISLTNTDKLDEEIQNLQKDLETAAADIQLWVNQNTVTQSDQRIYEKEYKKRVDIYKKISSKIEEKEQAKVLQINKQKEAINILRIMEDTKTAITEFDEGLFKSLIEHIIVKSSNLLIFTFKDGSEVEWEI